MAFEKFIAYEPNSGCWLWSGGHNKAGYGHYRMNGRTIVAHRAAYLMANPGTSFEGKVVMHKCDTPACVNPEHLRLATQSDNIQDMFRKGRGNTSKGESHVCAVLTEPDIIAIRKSSASLNEEARRYGVTRSAIWAIRHRVNWKHVNG